MVMASRWMYRTPEGRTSVRRPQVSKAAVPISVMVCRSFERDSDVNRTGASLDQFSFARRSCMPSRRSARVYFFISFSIAA